MAAGGYDKEDYWTEEGKRWLQSVKMKHPVYWVRDGGNTYLLRTLQRIIPMPWDWPVEVNNL